MLIVIFDKKKRDSNVNRMEIQTGKKKLEEKKIIQSVSYLPQINESPTSHFVVVETSRRSLKIADEGNRGSVRLTYDLAIAKIALQVKAEEKPTFDRIFIPIGSFQIEMAFFQPLGR